MDFDEVSYIDVNL